VPPLATNAEEYGTFTVPVVAATQERFRGGGAMVMPQSLVVVAAGSPVESTTLTVKLNEPAVVGVPVRAPVDASSVSPAGNDPAVIESV
jgi:hypothetical protein